MPKVTRFSRPTIGNKPGSAALGLSPGLLLCLLLSSTPGHAAPPQFKPGLWETTVTTEVQGMPAGMPGMGPQTRRECITAKDVNYTPQSGMDKSCKVDQKQKDANTMTWTVQCNHQGRMSSGRGEATTQGDSSSGFFEMNMQGGPHGEMVMKSTFKSRRVGDCSK